MAEKIKISDLFDFSDVQDLETLYKRLEQINQIYKELAKNINQESQAINKLELKMPISLEKIKKNYKKLVKIFHPDVNGNNKQAEEKFKRINESYKILLKKFIKKNEK